MISLTRPREPVPAGCRWVLYAGTGAADIDIFTVSPAGATSALLLAVPGNDLDPVWSPDRRRVAVATRAATPLARNIAVLDTATGTVTAVTSYTGGNTRYPAGPRPVIRSSTPPPWTALPSWRSCGWSPWTAAQTGCWRWPA